MSSADAVFWVTYTVGNIALAVTTPRVLRLRREIRYRVEAATRWQDKTPGWYRVPPAATTLTEPTLGRARR